MLTDLYFMSMFCRSLFVPLYFFFVIMLSVLLRRTDSDYPFVIFKLFLQILGYLLVSLVDIISN